ncbi:hypothetical protein AXG93_2189s1350 [Marchantia polymorpha subsp. ruderalis]|uniref:Tubby C-terminal domain-containing protein n=1 Tax=Marchantia polymorpha subsp. ruderalis TaxID=1480154 RepID=A0A176WSB6_MARPO|nr:hypothetical protein AXG93_2189s1350 [Marchantia polymorpha subsp. ruderalis]
METLGTGNVNSPVANRFLGFVGGIDETTCSQQLPASASVVVPGSLKSPRSRIEIPAPVSSAFCAPSTVKFVIEQKPFRKLNEKIYEIADWNGKRLFEADSLLFGGSRRLRDDKGLVLAHLKKKIVTMHERWEAHRGENSDELVFILRKESMFHKTAYNVFLASNLSMQTPDFTVRGDFEEQTYSIRHKDMPVAEALVSCHSIDTVVLLPF